mmetsp:Transcript_15947/g.30157  ORF Transcript_15947/g.30157 Transcript_15947/m.30157 type:complete len:255 (+) Transcript_15947:253-1017(+)
MVNAVQMVRKIGGRNSRISTNGTDLTLFGFQSLVERLGKHSIGEFGLRVSLIAGPTKASGFLRPAQVASIFFKIFPFEASFGRHVPRSAGVIDNAGIAVFGSVRFQQGVKFGRQEKMRQVIGLHLFVVSIDSGSVRRGHDTGVPANGVDATVIVFVLQRCGCLANAFEVLQVAIDGHKLALWHFVLQLRKSLGGTVRGTIEKDHFASQFGNGPGRHESSARCGARDHKYLVAIHLLWKFLLNEVVVPNRLKLKI